MKIGRDSSGFQYRALMCSSESIRNITSLRTLRATMHHRFFIFCVMTLARHWVLGGRNKSEDCKKYSFRTAEWVREIHARFKVSGKGPRATVLGRMGPVGLWLLEASGTASLLEQFNCENVSFVIRKALNCQVFGTRPIFSTNVMSPFRVEPSAY